MTCIVGLVQDGTVYLGGDSASANSWMTRSTRLKKVFRRGEFLIGYTSSFRMGQILQHHLDARPQESGEDIEHYMVAGFVEAVRKCLKKFAYTKVENSREEGGTFLIGYKGGLYTVQDDFQVNFFHDDYDAVGVGAQYALGAMRVLGGLVAPEVRILRALEAATHFCNGVCAPFYVDVLEQQLVARPTPSLNGSQHLVTEEG
jgi:ATP-dependent protease HslVU (ClpYQ) peptidase subunit